MQDWYWCDKCKGWGSLNIPHSCRCSTECVTEEATPSKTETADPSISSHPQSDGHDGSV